MIKPWYWPDGGQPHRAEPFTWIVEGKMAASWWPDNDVLKSYENEGVKVIINASEFDYRDEIDNHFTYYYINIPDYGIPTESQVQKFLKITDKHSADDEPMVVHCVAGCGRTGQLIVAWAAHNGYITKGVDPVKWIRDRRKCCLETDEQMNFARKMSQQYCKS